MSEQIDPSTLKYRAHHGGLHMADSSNPQPPDPPVQHTDFEIYKMGLDLIEWIVEQPKARKWTDVRSVIHKVRERCFRNAYPEFWEQYEAMKAEASHD